MAYSMDTYKIFSVKASRIRTWEKKKVITQAINYAITQSTCRHCSSACVNNINSFTLSISFLNIVFPLFWLGVNTIKISAKGQKHVWCHGIQAGRQGRNKPLYYFKAAKYLYFIATHFPITVLRQIPMSHHDHLFISFLYMWCVICACHKPELWSTFERETMILSDVCIIPHIQDTNQSFIIIATIVIIIINKMIVFSSRKSRRSYLRSNSGSQQTSRLITSW